MPFNNLVSIKACYSYTEDSQQKAWKEHTIWNNIIMCNIGTSCHIRGGEGVHISVVVVQSSSANGEMLNGLKS